MPNVRLSLLAADEFSQAVRQRGDYAGREAARKLRNALVEAMREAASFPDSGTRRPEFGQPTYRYKFADVYTIAYDPSTAPDVVIVRIFPATIPPRKIPPPGTP
jgi:plasmid stabilization system protein ParE